jgi:hypothetical protein
MNNYYNVGSQDNIVISNSLMGKINPEEGGSPQLFMQNLSNNYEQNDSISLNRGKLLHLYIEDPDEFSVMDFDKPTEGTLQCKLPELIFEKFPQKNDVELVEHKGKFIIFDEEYHKSLIYECGYKQFSGLTENSLEYLNYLYDSNNKIATDKKTQNILLNCIQSLKSNRVCYNELFNKEKDDEVIYNEIAIYFNLNVKILVKGEGVSVPLKCKCLIDKLKINKNYPVACITDLKTTHNSIYLFQNSFEKFRYYRQLSFYSLAVLKAMKGKALIKNKYGEDVTNFIKYPKVDTLKINISQNIIACETSNLFLSTLIPITRSWYEKGVIEYQSLLKRIAWHIYNNDFSQSYEEIMNGGRLKLTDPKIKN